MLHHPITFKSILDCTNSGKSNMLAAKQEEPTVIGMASNLVAMASTLLFLVCGSFARVASEGKPQLISRSGDSAQIPQVLG